MSAPMTVVSSHLKFLLRNLCTVQSKIKRRTAQILFMTNTAMWASITSHRNIYSFYVKHFFYIYSSIKSDSTIVFVVKNTDFCLKFSHDFPSVLVVIYLYQILYHSFSYTFSDFYI